GTGGSGGAGGSAAGGADGGVAGTDGGSAGTDGGTDAAGGSDGGVTSLNTAIQNIVIIYAENRTFDNMFGNFPGAHGLSEVVDSTGKATAAYVPQKDRDGTTVLATLPKTWGGVTLAGNPTVVTEAQSDGLANLPFAIETAYVAKGGPTLGTLDVTRDLTHRFFENQMELNGGTNDMFAAWLDAGGLTMGHFDQSQSKLYKLAQQYVLADNFFSGAFGGSFLNHQYLICACAPTVPASFITSNTPTITTLGAKNAKGVPQLALDASSPASALTNYPVFAHSTAIAPLDYFGTGDGYRAINTIQAPFQPSGNSPASAATGNDLMYADPASASTLPAQSQMTVGDQLTAANVDWAWYATSWTAAVADGPKAQTARSIIYTPSTARGVPDFQPHHQPYNYYSRFDPVAHADERTAHLKDYSDMVTAITMGKLPAVTWYKPTGNVNQHPGYANIDDGDSHIADLVAKLKASPQWAHMVIVITYDEYGGQWDHVAVPKGDLLGPGSRIPAIIISPYAKAGTVDHTQYDSASTIRLIEKRFGLAALPGITARDNALKAVSGGTAMGDLTAALNVSVP
ncbi:MAG TPA: acid phosphatase, partial [Polyangia bacterium]|nr:acid phosphatase [Polyangia bacterium]